MRGPIRVSGSRGIPYFHLRHHLQDQGLNPVINLPVNIGPLQGGTVLAAVDKGPPHQKFHSPLDGRVFKQDRGRQAAGPRKKELIKMLDLLFVRSTYRAPARDKENPHCRVLHALPPELPVVQPRYCGKTRQGCDDLLKQARQPGSLRGATEAKLISPKNGGPAHPGHHDRKRVIGQNSGYGAVRRFAGNIGHFHLHGAQMLHGHIQFHRRGAGGSADIIFRFRGEQLSPALFKLLGQLPQYGQPGGECLGHRGFHLSENTCFPGAGAPKIDSVTAWIGCGSGL